MSQPFRRVLAAVGLTAALLLVAAAPSQAAGHGKPMISGVGSFDVLARAWSWLQSLLPAPAPRAIQGKTTYTGTTPTIPVSPSPPPPSTGGQGSMIDPEGRT